MKDNKSTRPSASASCASSSCSTDEEIILLDARAVGSDDEDGNDTLFVLAIAAADDGSGGEYFGTEGARRLRRKRAQQKAAAAAAAAAAQLASAVEVIAVGPEAKKETAGAVEHVDADVSEVPDDTPVILTELMDANDDSKGGDDVEGAAPQPAAQPTMALTDAADAAVRQAEAEGLTLQPSSNATGYLGVYSDACSRHKAKPFKASFKEANKNVHLGSFVTAAEAALARARTLKAQARPQGPG